MGELKRVHNSQLAHSPEPLSWPTTATVSYAEEHVANANTCNI